jgi:YggT family protein
MHAILDFAFKVINGLIDLSMFLIIVYAVLSWLIAFNVVNLRNPSVYRATRALESVVRPVLRPIQRIIPSFGGMDFSPVIFLIVVGAIQSSLLPAFFKWLDSLFGGGAPS